MPTVSIPELPKRLGRVETLEMQCYWHKFFASADYRENLKKRILDGKAAHMEILLHHVTYGKPKETLALEQIGDGNLTLIIGGQTRVELKVDADGVARRALEASKELPGAIVEANGDAHD